MSDVPPQTQAELDAHYAPGGPVMAAVAFLTDVVERLDMPTAWPKVDPELRLVLAQAWIWANRSREELAAFDRDELAAALAVEAPTHPIWPDFLFTQLEEWNACWGDFNRNGWGAASRPRPVPPDCEMVIFMETGGQQLLIDGPTVTPGIGLLMRWVGDRWLVAGFDRVRPQPGWPPVARPDTGP